jgi:tRNA 2-thiouridine synthesizing protein D
MQTIEAALSKGHAVFCFLYQDGVHFAHRLRDVPQDETDPSDELARLASNPNCDVVTCITAAERRGVLSDHLTENIRVGGLGEWTEKLTTADRVVQFR